MGSLKEFFKVVGRAPHGFRRRDDDNVVAGLTHGIAVGDGSLAAIQRGDRITALESLLLKA